MAYSASTALLFLQVACILATCVVVGRFAARVGQPRVIAEMLTGFMLGPSLFGWVAPATQAALFPAASLGALSVLSQLGVVLYMFAVGLEFDVERLRGVGRRAVSVSIAGIIGPFALGGALGGALERAGGFFPDAVSPLEAALFMGAAMSITAFPVLARIIRERGIGGTTVGTVALSAGALDDAAAWMILAVVLGGFSGHAWGAIVTVAGAIGYVLIVLRGLRPFLAKLAAGAERTGRLNTSTFVEVLTALMLGAWFTERIGVHAVFGAFLLGTSVPRGVLTEQLRRQIEPLASGVLVPLFFVYTGLQTHIGLVNTPWLWLLAAVILLTACGGKGIFCWLAARLTGASQREGLAVATLMNARGMVELILLNIGLSRGLITPTLYTMLVLMAIATTVMTGPVFSLVWNRGHQDDLAGDAALISSGLP